jgi:hypothetical protein
MRAVPFEKHDVVRIGMVGTGLAGRSLLRDLLGVPNAQIVALCDLVPDKAQRARRWPPTRGRRSRRSTRLRSRVRAPRRARRSRSRLHRDAMGMARPVMLAALAHGKHAASECPIGTTLKDLWALVDASERARKHCIQLENCNYGYNEMMVNRMVHAGLFGECCTPRRPTCTTCGRSSSRRRTRGSGARVAHALQLQSLSDARARPVSWYLDVHAGDRFDYIVAMATPERGLTLYREETLKDNKADPRWRERYVTGDLNTSIIRRRRDAP